VKICINYEDVNSAPVMRSNVLHQTSFRDDLTINCTGQNSQNSLRPKITKDVQ